MPQKYLDLYERILLSLPASTKEQDRERVARTEDLFSDGNLRAAKYGYYAMISESEVDHYVGVIRQILTDCGLAENTVVIFTSDHGEWLGDHLRYAKNYPADDANSRVLLVIAAPDAHAAQRYSGIAESVDTIPTILSLTGIQCPSQLQDRSACT